MQVPKYIEDLNAEYRLIDKETIVLETSMGRLVIKGDNLKILSFDNSSYDLLGEGKIHALVYTMEEKSGGFLSKIFR